jgi:hypothetical protein
MSIFSTFKTASFKTEQNKTKNLAFVWLMVVVTKDSRSLGCTVSLVEAF